MRRVVILGAGGRDFHNFNMVYRDDPATEVVAFTAAQIPGIDHRVYPVSLAGTQYPEGIVIRPEADLPAIIRDEQVDEVVLAYSDLSYDDVMHRASVALAAGADFRLLGPKATMLHASKPVVAVCGVRTGVGKSQTSRRVGRFLLDEGLRVALVRHPMPYGDLARMRAQRFATLEDIDASHPTIEEREEYEEPVRSGMIVYAGVDYGDVLRRAERDADVIIWDGGNNDFSFFAPDLLITVTDALRPGHESAYYPGEANVRMADIIVVNKVDSADDDAVARVVANAQHLNPRAQLVRAASPVTLDPGPSLVDARVLVVEDGPTITHGGMPFGAGTVAAGQAGATQFVDPRPYAAGSIAETFATYPHIGRVLPAMGYGDAQLAELADTIRATPCDVVVAGTPIDLGRVVDAAHPIRRAKYELRELGTPTLGSILTPLARRWSEPRHDEGP
jgi:predicted GTPase